KKTRTHTHKSYTQLQTSHKTQTEPVNNKYIKDERCNFHPGEFVIGICALCLNEKLLILASKQGPNHLHRQTHKNFSTKQKISPAAKIKKIFSLLNLVEPRKRKSDHNCHSSYSASPDDSFISFKIEDNGDASWDKGSKIPKIPLDQQCEEANKVKRVVEHAKPRVVLKWRRRIGHIFQVIRLKKPTKGSMWHVSTKRRRSKG
ncbi:beta-galactosidase-1-like protein, partial [Striga asiatica]